MSKIALKLTAEQARSNIRSVTDPVCGMQISPAEAAGMQLSEGRVYYFCSPQCQEKFRQRPAQRSRLGRLWQLLLGAQ